MLGGGLLTYHLVTATVQFVFSYITSTHRNLVCDKGQVEFVLQMWFALQKLRLVSEEDRLVSEY